MLERRASIDIGSNSVLLLVAQLHGEEFEVLESLSEVTGLGRQLDKNGKFLDDSMEFTIAALRRYVQVCQGYGISPVQIVATATEAARVSENAMSFLKRVEDELNLSVKIITSDAEAYYSAHGILFDKEIRDKYPVVMDIGGASTEIIKVETESQKLLFSFSMPMGAVRFTNWREDGILEQKFSTIQVNFKDQLAAVKTDYLHCVAGTMTSVANMCLGHKEFKENDVHGLELAIKQIVNLRKKTLHFTPQQYQQRYPFLGKRSATISGGIDLALRVCKCLGVKKVRISTYGLRYGTLLAGAIRAGDIFNGNGHRK